MLSFALLFDYRGAGLCFGALFGLSFGMGVASATSITQDVIPPEHKRLCWGMAVFCRYIVAAWAPAIVGMISDGMGGGAGGLKVALIIMGPAGGVLSFFCYWEGAKHYVDDLARVKDCALKCEN